MSKHRKHKKQQKLNQQQSTDVSMYQCDICKKRYPYDGHPATPASTPFMFVAVGDTVRRCLSILVCTPDIELYEGEQALAFVCSDRQCIYKAFLLWRAGDVQLAMVRGSFQQIAELAKEGAALLAKEESSPSQDA